MRNDKCKNCGGDEGIHHYQTNQCPVGGREAPLGRKQEYKTTTYEPDNSDELEELRSSVKKLFARVEELEESVRIYGAAQQGVQSDVCPSCGVDDWAYGDDTNTFEVCAMCGKRR